MRLIDADAMRQGWLEDGENEYAYDTNAVLDSIDEQPTVDAVEVVRCRECMYQMGDCACCVMDQGGANDGFCYYGERKEND